MKLTESIAEKLSGPNYKWIIIGLLFVAGFLNLEDRVVIFSVLPLIKTELHLTDVELGALMSVFLWVYALFSPFAGNLGDRWSRRKVLINCVLWWSVITILAGFATSGTQLIGTRVLLGLSQAFYIPASMAILADYHDSETRGKAVALLIVGMNLGPILGGALAGWIGDHYGWRPTLWILGLIGMFLALLLVAFLKNPPKAAADIQAPDAGNGQAAPQEPFAKAAAAVLKIPSFCFLMLATAMFAVGVWILMTWLPIFLNQTFGMTLAQSGFYGNLAITGPAIIGYLIGGTISDSLGATKPGNRMLLLVSFYALAIPWPLVFSSVETAALALLTIAAMLLFRSLGEASWYPLVYELIGPQRRSTAIGIANSVNCIFGGLGAVVAGYYRERFGLQGVFALACIPVLIAAVGLLISHRFFLRSDLARAAAQEVTTGESAAPAPRSFEID